MTSSKRLPVAPTRATRSPFGRSSRRSDHRSSAWFGAFSVRATPTSRTPRRKRRLPCWERLGVTGGSHVVHFASRVAVQTAMNVRRREAAAKRRATGDRVDLDAIADVLPGARHGSRRPRQRRARPGLLATLPEAQAEALAMHCVLGFTVAEIAEASELPLETVRSRLRLAKNSLRDRAEATPALARLIEAAG